MKFTTKLLALAIIAGLSVSFSSIASAASVSSINSTIAKEKKATQEKQLTLINFMDKRGESVPASDRK